MERVKVLNWKRRTSLEPVPEPVPKIYPLMLGEKREVSKKMGEVSEQKDGKSENLYFEEFFLRISGLFRISGS